MQSSSSTSAHLEKGPPTEEDLRRPRWWQFSFLGELQQRPAVWTANSTILFAHPALPSVCGRVFPSTTSFVLVSPSAISAAPTTYDPPTIITASPDDNYLFAYFPSKQGAGVGCLWARTHIDQWAVKEWWSVAQGKGIVTASWLGYPRQWVTDTTGHPSRLPLLGPRTPATLPSLVLVSEDMHVQVCYTRLGATAVKFLSCSLTRPDDNIEDATRPVPDADPRRGGIRLCAVAAVGLGYDEPSVIVATKSHLVPGTESNLALDMSMSLDIPDQFSEMGEEWEGWGEDNTIELCEIRLGFDGIRLHLTSRPLPPLESTEQISRLLFVPADPGPSRQPDGPILPQVKMHLVASSVDFGDFSSPPSTELVSYSLKRVGPGIKISQPGWLASKRTSQLFNNEILLCAAPHYAASGASTLQIATVQPSLYMSRGKRRSKEVTVGRFSVLHAESLYYHDEWPSIPLVVPVEGHSRCLPSAIALSPRGSLACSISSLSSTPVRVSIHTLPSLSRKGTPEAVSESTRSLLTSLRAAQRPADAIHRLTASSTPLVQIEHTLLETLTELETRHSGLRDAWFDRFCGVCVEVYRARALHAKSDGERQDLDSRWRVARDMCSIAACHSAFVHCQERDNDDMEAVWPLVVLSSWVVRFLEDLMRECVILGDGSDDTKAPPLSTPIPPIFLHILHPDALARLRATLADVRRFYDILSRFNARGENSQLAKSVLVDTVECSGLNLDKLDAVLADVTPPTDAPALAQSLAHCRPHPSLHPHLHALIAKLTHAGVLDRPQLFLKPADLVAGFAKMGLDTSEASEAAKDGPRDVIDKGTLNPRMSVLVCSRCAGRTQVGAHPAVGRNQSSKGWAVWQRKWAVQCLCGGMWSSAAPPML